MVQVLSTLREDSEQMQKQLRDIREKKAAIDVAKGNIQSALADLKNMNARDPMTWVGDHWFSGAEGERQSVLSRLLEVQDLLVATDVKFAQAPEHAAETTGQRAGRSGCGTHVAGGLFARSGPEGLVCAPCVGGLCSDLCRGLQARKQRRLSAF
jgi:hypothetical protein